MHTIDRSFGQLAIERLVDRRSQPCLLALSAHACCCENLSDAVEPFDEVRMSENLKDEERLGV